MNSHSRCSYSVHMSIGVHFQSPCSDSTISSNRENYFTTDPNPESWGLQIQKYIGGIIYLPRSIDVVIVNRGSHVTED